MWTVVNTLNIFCYCSQIILVLQILIDGDSQVAQFIFNHNERQPRKYVFVHCTHGHNRTGYMIVHYLMRTQQASCVTEVSHFFLLHWCIFYIFDVCVSDPLFFKKAIQRFAEARPPGIYKQDYIDALYAFYHETKSDLAVCPSTPEWKRSSDFDLNGEALPEDDDGVPYTSINVWIIFPCCHLSCITTLSHKY